MFAHPEKILKQLELREDMIVADLGAGTGFYAVLLGAMVPLGKVYAIEILPDYLTTIRHKIREANLSNVECLWGDVEKLGGTKLKEGIVDAVLASNVLFQLSDRHNFIKEISRILKPSGKVLFLDWDGEAPDTILQKKHTIPKEKVLQLFEGAGFVLKREVDAGAHHYGMIFVRHK